MTVWNDSESIKNDQERMNRVNRLFTITNDSRWLKWPTSWKILFRLVITKVDSNERFFLQMNRSQTTIANFFSMLRWCKHCEKWPGINKKLSWTTDLCESIVLKWFTLTEMTQLSKDVIPSVVTNVYSNERIDSQVNELFLQVNHSRTTIPNFIFDVTMM